VILKGEKMMKNNDKKNADILKKSTLVNTIKSYILMAIFIN
jgi:hypothetical protein